MIVLSVFLGAGSLFSAEKEYDVTEEYGPKLDQVSFKERFLYNKSMNKDWYKSTLEDRRVFLLQYHEDLVEARKRKLAQQKEDAIQEKIEMNEKKEEDRNEKIRKDKIAREEKERERYYKEEKLRLAKKHAEIKRKLKALRKGERKSNRKNK